MRSAPTAARVLGVAALLAIAALTLGPESATTDRPPFWCMACGQLDVLDTLLNVALFIPFGVALRLRPTRIPVAALVGFAVSATVELLQRHIPGREPSARDILTNTVGTVVGALLVGDWRPLLRPTRRQAALLSLGTLCVSLGVTVGGAWALRPLPPWGAWYGPRTARRHNEPPRFAGHVTRASLRPEGRSTPPNAEIDATLVVDKLQPARALMLVFENADEDEAYALMVRGRDLIVRRRLRAASLRLRNPAVVLHDLLPADVQAGAPLHVHVTFSPSTIAADLDAGTDAVHRERSVTALNAWAVLSPFDLAIGDSRVPTAIWILTLLLAPGYFLVMALRPQA